MVKEWHFFVQRHISVVLRKDIMSTDAELIWLQIYLPYCKPILVGCCCRPPSPNVKYLDRICENVDIVTDENNGDLNIDWFSKNWCKKLVSMTDVYNVTQSVTQPTRILTISISVHR